MIISLLRYYRLKLIWGLDDESFYNMLFYGQGSVALYFIVMIVCLRVLKPRKGAFTWMTISLSVIIVVSLNLILKGVHFGSVVVPFSGSAIMTQTFISEVVAGVFVLWFYVIAERSLITEKRLLIERTKRLTDEKKLVENRLKLLQAQIEPQFLFNTLENIVQLREDSLDKAKSMQSHFIRYLRATLTKTRGKDTTIAQEMELIRAYLDIFKIRMGERLRY
ncbi:MAG: histidine kinase, partial [Desulfatitalea sp.]|nr:histidine kinase [Desulfatitalea sp.]